MTVEDSNPDWHIWRHYLVRAETSKLIVPIFQAARTWYCVVITSNPNRFVHGRPKLLPCEVAMPQHLHPAVLKWDSYVYVNKLSLAKVPVDASRNDTVEGVVHRDCRKAIVEAVQACPDLPGRTKNLMLEAFRGNGDAPT